MERLVVDNEGKLVIPPEITDRFGLHPGDEVSLVQTPQSLIVCSPGQALLEEWWNSLSDEDKAIARQEAEHYESLSEAERDAIWNEGAEELEKWLDGDEDDDAEEGEVIDLATLKRAV